MALLDILKLDSLKEQFSIAKLRENKYLAPVVSWYDGLPPDQKNIAGIGFIAGGVLLVFFFVYLGYSTLDSLKEEIENKNINLKELSRYQEQFKEQDMILKQLEREAKRQSSDFSLLSALEQLAQASQIGRESIESISPKQLPPGNYFIETEATVQLVKVSLRQLTDYFYKIESSANNMNLREVRVKPRFDNPQYLNVTFKVSSYKPKE